MSKDYKTGAHFLGTIYTKDSKKLLLYRQAKKIISRAIKENGFEELGSFYHDFSQGGFTGVIALRESHVALHTWPEFNCLTLDVYVCNFKKDNGKNCQKLFEKLVKFFGNSWA